MYDKLYGAKNVQIFAESNSAKSARRVSLQKLLLPNVLLLAESSRLLVETPDYRLLSLEHVFREGRGWFEVNFKKLDEPSI